jgi:acyl transferase domain-containing protein/acyl carrier protein
LAVVGNSRAELSNSLQAYLSGRKVPHLFTGSDVPEHRPRMAFVFPGQGGQWQGMGRELLEQEPVFCDAIQQIDNVIRSRFSWSLLDVLYTDNAEQWLNEIDQVQPALFAIQVALARLWQSWGITPDAVIGHSMGEIAAAHIAGVLTLEDAIQIVCSRSQLLKKVQGQGRMLATELTPGDAEELLNEFDNDASVAVINSPASTVISGSTETIEKFRALLERQNIYCKLVNVDVASHSPQMNALQAELLEVLSGLNPQPARIPLYSTVTGGPGDPLSFGTDYWFDNLRKPVLFSGAVNQLLESGHTIFIELGPHPVLLGSIQQTAQPHYCNTRLLPSMRRGEAERKTMLQTLAALYSEGFSIAWNKLYPTRGKHVRLPMIPWQRQRYWLDTPATSSKITGHSAERFHPLLGVRVDLANTPSSFVWQASFDETMLTFLQDHRVENEVVFPAAGYIEMALQCVKEAGFTSAYEWLDFVFKERMILQCGKTRIVQSHLSPGNEGHFVFCVYSRTDEDKKWELHASADFRQNTLADHSTGSGKPDFNAVYTQSTLQYLPEEFYRRMQSYGLHYGPAFQGLQQIWSNERCCLGLVRLPEALQHESTGYQLHPALLDACLQVMAALPNASLEQSIYLPAGCRKIRFYRQPGHLLWSQVTLNTASAPDADVMDADISLFNNNQEKVAELIGFRLQRVSRRVHHLPSAQTTWFYRLQWQPKPEQCTQSGFVIESKQWLILADNTGLGEELARQIEAGGGHCQLWYCEDAAEKTTNANTDFLPAFMEKRLNEISSPIDGIVHLWSLSARKYSSAGDGNVVQSDGCESTLSLVQALAKRIMGTPRLWLVTRGAQAVNDGESITVEQSALWGLGKVISFELPEFACTRIDLDPAQSNSECALLLTNAISADDREDQIAYRAGTRYVHRLLPFTHNALFDSPTVRLKANGTYLITGGFGGLGLKTAEWMATQGAKHLVLIGRSEPSPAARRVVEHMQLQGVDVMIAQADVSDMRQLQSLMEEVKDRMPVLRGVIHAAGVLDDGALLNLNRERMRKVMAPKVAGTWNLHEATAGLPLDFFVLFSSAVSVLGSPGQGNYAAASAFLDAFAHFRRHQGLPAISINWGPWADVGLAAGATEKLKEQNASTEHLIKVIQIHRGLEILGHLLTEATPQILVLPFDLKNLIELYPTAAGLPFLAEVGGGDTHTVRLYARPHLRQPYVAPATEVERKLVQLWQQTLHIDRVGVHDSFFELGGDSVLAAQVLASAQKGFGIRIDPQDAFQAFTIKKLAELLEDKILHNIEAMSEEEAQRLLAERNLYDE